MIKLKKNRIIQISLFIIGTLILFFTYSDKKLKKSKIIIPTETKTKLENSQSSQDGSDTFYNIEYSGFDLEGNRYVLKAEEAINNKDNQDIVIMKLVNAYFYFKDDTVVEVKSDAGIYNNRTLDMKFNGNIKALYDKSKLFAQKAEYSNSKSYLTVYDKVEIIDTKGTMVADKLFFDIKNGTLDISSMNNNLVNTQLNLK
tara:strand:- start:41 stop:640 length:600 start_codon:yes stop_codon:yes gene_type:complete